MRHFVTIILLGLIALFGLFACGESDTDPAEDPASACPPACERLNACGDDPRDCPTFCQAFRLSFADATIGACSRATYGPWFTCVVAASSCTAALECEANPNIPECGGG